MTWKKQLFDEENPSISKQIVIYYLMIIIICCFYGIWADFVPNNTFKNIGNGIAITLSLVVSIQAYRNIIIKPNYRYMRMNKGKKILVLLVLPFWIYSFSWLFWVHSLPAAYTKLAGASYQITGIFKKRKSPSRRSCEYRITSDTLKNAFPSYMCISKRYYENNEPEFKLVGLQSIVGELYNGVYSIPR